MPWKLDHKCNAGDDELRDFTALKTVRGGQNVTVMLCESCKEQVVMVGHEIFGEAVHNDRLGSNLPPGFFIPRSPRSS